MSTVVTYSHQNCSTGLDLTKSQIRNAQRRHTAACLKQGILIAKERRALYDSMMQICQSGEAAVLLESLAIHRQDCHQLEHNVHYAAEANYIAYSAGGKTACSYNQHKRIHRLANLVKHEHGIHIVGNSLPPPPPPPLAPPSDTLLTCEAIEKAMLTTARVQYIVVEVPLVLALEAPVPTDISGDSAEPHEYSKPATSILIDEVSMVYTLGAIDIVETPTLREADSAYDILDALRMEEETQSPIMIPSLTIVRPSSQQYTEPETELVLSSDGLQEPTICKISSNLKVMVLSALDVTAITAKFIHPGQHFSAMARLTHKDRTYFELPCAAGYIPLHSRKDISKMVVDQACGNLADLNPEQVQQYQVLCNLPKENMSSLLKISKQPGVFEHELVAHAALRLIMLMSHAGSAADVPCNTVFAEAMQQEQEALFVPPSCNFCKGVGCTFCQEGPQAATSTASGSQECNQQ